MIKNWIIMMVICALIRQSKELDNGSDSLNKSTIIKDSALKFDLFIYKYVRVRVRG